MATDEDLLAQIEQDTLDGSTPIADALRKCVVLGGKSGSTDLRDWATRELKGYDGSEEELPGYRIIAAPLQIDGVSGNYKITGQQYPPSALPEFAREHLTEEVRLADGVGGLEALLKQADIKLMPPMAADLARVMNTESSNPHQHVISIYWHVSHSAVHGVLDQIRTALAQLVAEIRANMPGDERIPSAENANQAVHVVVTGRRSMVNVNTAQAGGEDANASVALHPPESESPESPFWTRWRKVGAFAVGLATIAGAVAAIAQSG